MKKTKQQIAIPNKAVIYCRVSSQEQVQGTSLEGQKKACLEYAENKLSIPEPRTQIFIERGESATAANRTELIKALDYCQQRKGEVGAFIVWKIDRFARNTTDHFFLKAQLSKYGVVLHSVTEPISNDPMGRMTETMLAGYAQFENDIRKTRCEGGMQRLVQNGLRPWQPPLGYVHSKDRHDKRKTEPDRPDPERFHLVQKIFKEYLTGDYTMTALAQKATQWSLRTRTGREITKQRVDCILTDKYYAGILVDPWSGEEYVGKHQPMISKEEFAQVQLIKHNRSHGTAVPRVKLNADFPLRQFVKCENGHRMSGGWRQGHSRKYAYYCCRKEACPHHMLGIPVNQLHDSFFGYLREITPTQETLQAIKESVLDELEGEMKTHTTEREHHEKQLNTLKTKIARLEEMRMNGEITQERFFQLKGEVENQMIGTQISTNESKIEELDVEAVLNFGIRFLHDLAGHWRLIQDVGQKQKLQRLVLPDGVIFNRADRICTTTELSPIFATKKTYPADTSHLVAGTRVARVISWL